MFCDKHRISTRKDAKRRAKVSRMGFYHCKECNAWHLYTPQKAKRRSNAQHSFGGRKSWRRGTTRR